MIAARRVAVNQAMRGSWYDCSWDWAIISLFALVLVAGVAVWTSLDHSQTAAILEDATTGQSTR